MSYAASTTLINNISSDAAFRTWGSAYNAKLTSMGLVDNADTGSINWATVTTPGVANTVAGFEVWRMDDALQATIPIFIKVEYGSGTAAADGSIWITLGSGTNGSGTLSGITSIRQQVKCTATAGAITHYWSGDTNRLSIAVVGASAATSMLICIERTVDTLGAVTGEGALLIYRGASLWGQQAWNQVTGPYTATWEATLGAMGPAVAPFGVFGTQLAVYPVFHNKGVFLSPGLNVYVYENATIASGSTISFTVYGSAHTYIPLGSPEFGSAARGGFSSAANATAMMRYE